MVEFNPDRTEERIVGGHVDVRIHRDAFLLLTLVIVFSPPAAGRLVPVPATGQPIDLTGPAQEEGPRNIASGVFAMFRGPVESRGELLR